MLGALLAAGLACGGCGEPDAGWTAPGSTTRAILGGVPDATDTAVVALQIETSEGERGLCTGVVIAPRVVLTAAHCVSPQAVGPGATFSVVVGSDLNDATQVSLPGAQVAVERVAFDPEFDLGRLASGHDVGVAITVTPLDVVPVAFDPVPALDGVAAVRIVGYGLSSTTAPAGDHSGRRLHASVPLSAFDPLFLTLGQGATPCLGDSGGPAFVDTGAGTGRLAGIVSFTDNACGPGAKVTHLAAYVPFLRAQVAAVDNDGDEAEAGGACGVAPGGSGAASTGLVGLLLPLLVLGLLGAVRRRRRNPGRTPT